MKTDTDATSRGIEPNQRLLMEAVARLRGKLETYSANRAGGLSTAEQVRSPSAAPKQSGRASDPKTPPTLDALCRAFDLSSFERDVLLLCAAVELDGTLASRCAAAQDNPHHPYPTFGLALSSLDNPHWSALTPEAPLRRWRLVEVDTHASLTTGRLRIDEWVLHYLAGTPYIDPRVVELIESCEQSPSLAPSHLAVADRVVELWYGSSQASHRPVIQICGADPLTKRAIASAACQKSRIRLHALRAGDLPASPADREVLCRLWEREAALLGSALLVDCDHAATADDIRHAWAFVNRLQAMVIVSARDTLRDLTRPTVRLDTAAVGWEERRALWVESLGSWAKEVNGRIDDVATQFNLPPQDIRAAGVHALKGAQEGNPSGSPDPSVLGLNLWEQCRVLARRGLDDLAQRIEPRSKREDLILPEAQLQTLEDIATHARHRATVYERWGFADKSSRGLGISALFWGSSGTGKTTAAEILAGQLRLDMYRIDLSSVVSKYIGETEKNLCRVFDVAEAGGSILLFDEADALFGKRSEVKDSHDRHANIEVSYLLQRMESYRGLAILTTNLKENLDSAFLRRIRFMVRFPFPDAAHRAEIWRRVLPERMPTADLDIPKLARLKVTGGNISNIALHAAFHAAKERAPLSMAHLLRAARAEYLKLDKPLTETEIKGWVQ